VVDGSLVRQARDIGDQPETYLGNNDSYAFLARVDSRTREKHHMLTGPTGTNVMDLQIILVEGKAA
jgi:glycerate 2-kinase